MNSKKPFVTLVNSIFDIRIELPCFFEFLQNCTPRREGEVDYVYGPYCMRHAEAMYKKSQYTFDMQPKYLRNATDEPNMFLWSFLINVTYEGAKDLISFMDISRTESNNLAKFIEVISGVNVSRQNSAEYQRLMQYLSAYHESARNSLKSIKYIDKILIPMNMSKAFIDGNYNNTIVSEIVNKAQRNDIRTQAINESTTQYFVPLNMLNPLDQINILSFRMKCGTDADPTLAPNVSISDGRMIIGSGLPVRKNQDVLVLSAEPVSEDEINPKVFVADRKYLDLSFDINKLDN